jgi:hypothetical protein
MRMLTGCNYEANAIGRTGLPLNVTQASEIPGSSLRPNGTRSSSHLRIRPFSFNLPDTAGLRPDTTLKGADLRLASPLDIAADCLARESPFCSSQIFCFAWE